VRHAVVIAALGATLSTAAGSFPAALRFGRSIGSPTEGRLVGGMHLDEAPYIRVEPADASGDVRWGLAPLVTMVDRAARAVARQFPGTITSVGHLSRRGGGDVERHRSHESGRDADVAFFVRGPGGHQWLAPHFVAFRGDGTAPTWPGARFDDAKNWAFLAALLGDSEARVTHVFVSTPLRARLLAYAERVGAPEGLRLRAADVMRQPRAALAHDDHFHVRIACPLAMSGCVEDPAPRPRSPAAAFRTARPRGVEPVHTRVTPAPHRAQPDPEGTPSATHPIASPPAAPASLLSAKSDVDG
jgi:penicillin-insensitive murein endopeptidase